MTLPTAVPKPERTPKKARRPLPPPTKPIAKVNRKRAKRLFAEDFGDRAYVEYLHSRPCDVCEMEAGFTEAAHTKTRGSGGKVDDLVSLCGNRRGIIGCRRLYDEHDESVRSHELRLRTLAKKLRADWLENQLLIGRAE